MVMSALLDSAVGSDAGGRLPGPTLLYLIRQVDLAARSRLDEAVRVAEVTVPQYTALTVLERHPEMTSAKLARHSFVRAQTMAQMITTLEERRLIHRAPDPNSRRQYLLSLTPGGQAVLDTLRGKVRDIEEQLVAGLSGVQETQLREALISCRSALTSTRVR
jgi:DNA-binding MarR family transcriptional regulator